MHRRARHLTGRAAGASFHYDARWLSFSDGNSVGTITDLAGTNNLTQATTADQAIYKVNILNGNPVLRFDGTTDFYSLTTSISTSGEYVAISLVKNTGIVSPLFTYRATTDGVPYLNYFYNGTIYATADDGTFSASGSPLNSFSQSTSYTNNSHTIRQIYIDGSPVSTSYSGYYLVSSNIDTLGRRDWDNPDSFLTGDFAAAIYIRGSQAASLRKRFEHAIGFSFKIACS